MASMIEQRAALLAEADKLQAKAADMTSEDLDRLNAIIDEVVGLSDRIKAADEAKTLVKSFTTVDGAHQTEPATEGRTLGERFIKSAQMRDFRARYPKGIGEKQAEAARGLTVVVGKKSEDVPAEPASSVISRPVAGLPFESFDQRIVNPLEYGRRLSILNLITHGTTEAQAMRYRQILSMTNNAAIVPESLDEISPEYLKPISTLGLGQATAVDTTYADGVYITTQQWNDDGTLRAVIDSMLRRNIELVTENMVLNGTGEDGQPLGILNADGLNVQAFDTDILTTVRKARAILDGNGYTASALVVSSNDATAIDLLKTENGSFYGGGPLAAGGVSTLWGVPVVSSPKVEDGTAIMGDWATIHLLTIDPLNINVFDQHMDFAERNLLYLRAEYRALQLLYSPASFVKVELGN